jgi:hypothetical protein
MPEQEKLVGRIADLFQDMEIGEQQPFVDPYQGVSGWVTRTVGGYRIEMMQPTPRGAAQAVAAHLNLSIAVTTSTPKDSLARPASVPSHAHPATQA